MALPLLKKMLLGLTLGSISLWPAVGFTQERLPEKTLMVQGAGTVTVQPDTFTVQLGVETQGKTVATARSENAKQMNQVMAALKQLHIPHLVLQTTGFNVSPQYETEPSNRPRIVGYMVSNTLSAKVEGLASEQLGEAVTRVIDTALSQGANSMNGVSFSVSKDEAAQAQALQLAVEQARHSAEAIAKAAGVVINGIYTIDAYAPPLANRMAVMPMMAEAKLEQSTPIEAGEFDVTANVTIRFNFQD